MYLVKENYGTATKDLLATRIWVNVVSPPARQLESVFRFVKDRADIVDAHDCCAQFLENCAGAFSDKSGQCRLATAEPVSARP